jgi:DNA-binding NarL/FixJ family response regulator
VIRLAIVEDHAVMAQGLEALLEGEEDIALVGTANDLATGRALVARDDVDVVLCDIMLGGEQDGFSLLSSSTKGRRPAFIMFSAFGRPGFHARAIELGAAGYLNKLVSIEELTRTIRTVANGGRALSSIVLRSARAAPSAPSDRQLEVIGLVAEGHRNEEIARLLSIRVKTVEGQLRRLFDKYGVNNRVELVRLAEQQGWITAPGDR